MLAVAEEDIARRIRRDNPWWAESSAEIRERSYPRRVYFAPFRELALNWQVNRAAILLGPRRVGKTVMVKQLVASALDEGFDPKRVMYVSVDTPIYAGIALGRFLEFIPDSAEKRAIVLFDEIQYLKDWELHLKDLIDTHPNVKFIATGSAAAALRLKSKESGAGRFSEFMLPPLTFFEYLQFIQVDEELIVGPTTDRRYAARDIDAVNDHFVDYLNFGGYPEVVLNPSIRANTEQFIRNDIVDKVLLKDLPSLYGINDIQELNRLFSFLAYNAGSEANLENICQESGLAKPTIKKYIEYLESAFLIIKLTTVDDNCRTLKRERNFKIYLSNPSMRAALFGPVERSNTQLIGHLAESAVFSQWQHSANFNLLRYARWRNPRSHGEVDCVYLEGFDQKPGWMGEIKWSDRVSTHYVDEVKNLYTMCVRHKKSLRSAFFTTKTISAHYDFDGLRVNVWPTSMYCYTVGRNITAQLKEPAAS